mmetsp:Transcript_7721/g.23187  ORF Transcript_7721/g.23187 Transcript_7721/m.23187 type:complete len:808 (-) Transcript_7721:1002-3425(-)
MQHAALGAPPPPLARADSGDDPFFDAAEAFELAAASQPQQPQPRRQACPDPFRDCLRVLPPSSPPRLESPLPTPTGLAPLSAREPPSRPADATAAAALRLRARGVGRRSLAGGSGGCGGVCFTRSDSCASMPDCAAGMTFKDLDEEFDKLARGRHICSSHGRMLTAHDRHGRPCAIKLMSLRSCDPAAPPGSFGGAVAGSLSAAAASPAAVAPGAGRCCSARTAAEAAAGEGESLLSAAVREAHIHMALSDEPSILTVHEAFATRVSSQLLSSDGGGASSCSTDDDAMSDRPGEAAVVLQMPLMEGDLEEYMRSRAAAAAAGSAELRLQPDAETAALIVQVINSVRKCHAAGVLHRDVQPSNFLMGPAGQLLLGDFGMAGFIVPSDAPQRGATGCDVRTVSSRAEQRPGGSLEYMSPARLLGGDDGTAGDWWSVGVLILELIETAGMQAGGRHADAGIGARRWCEGGSVASGGSGCNDDSDDCDDTCGGHDSGAWPFQARKPSAAALSALGLSSENDLTPSAACVLSWLEAVHLADIQWPRAASPAAMAAVSGLLRPCPTARWGLEELLASDLLTEDDFVSVAKRHPQLQADMQELLELRGAAHMAQGAGSTASRRQMYRTRRPHSCGAAAARAAAASAAAAAPRAMCGGGEGCCCGGGDEGVLLPLRKPRLQARAHALGRGAACSLKTCVADVRRSLGRTPVRGMEDAPLAAETQLGGGRYAERTAEELLRAAALGAGSGRRLAGYGPGALPTYADAPWCGEDGMERAHRRDQVPTSALGAGGSAACTDRPCRSLIEQHFRTLSML